MRILSIFIVVLLLFTSCTSLSVNSQVMVSGRCELEIEPDILTFSLSVTERGETTKEAQEGVNNKVSRALSILKDQYLIDKKDIKTTYMSVYPENSWIDGKQVLIGQKASQSIEVTVRDISCMSEIFDSLTEVSGISISNINLDSSKKDEYLALARKNATDDARRRADDYGASQNMKSGKVLSIVEKGFNSQNVGIGNSMFIKASAASMDNETANTDYHFSSITVSAEVDAVFELVSDKSGKII